MRTLVLERNEEIVYHVPFSRSFSILTNGFTPEEIGEIRSVLSGKSEHGDYATEIRFNKPQLLNLLDDGSKDLGSAIDSIEIKTDVEDDPVTDDIADAILAKINNQISLLKRAKSSKGKKQEIVRSEPSEIQTLSVSNRLVDMIKKYEGFRANPYTCPGGVLTIGYGTTMKPGQYTSITKEQADAILRRTISGFERSVKNLVVVPLNQNQFDALVSFAYNVGAGALKRSTLLKELNSGDYEGAANELTKFVRSNGKILPGLVKRREEERNLFLS
jgi:GH24 family phage-related lysozyme (muramidase)